MDKDFFKNWTGYHTDKFLQKRWCLAEGSSLSQRELITLSRGGIVSHQKGSLATKVFARDSYGSLWSVIIPSIHIPYLKKDLEMAGFVVK